MPILAWAWLTLAAAAAAALIPGRAARIAHAGAACGACVVSLACGLDALAGAAPTLRIPLSLLGSISFTLTPLRGLFIVIAAGVYAAALPGILREAHAAAGRRCNALRFFTAALVASMLAVLAAGDVLSFVFTWEIMSLALWALVCLGAREEWGWRAALATIGFSEAGAIAGLAGLLLLAAGTGSTELALIARHAGTLPESLRWAAFLLTFYGFGVKTGIAPVNAWMREGYAAAPTSVRALFSGATLNLGVFALWTIDAPLAVHTPWMGLVVLATGALTALLGILYALLARDLGRLLTESSIENLGIVVAAIGAGCTFIAYHHPVLGGIALVAGLYHMLNHSVYKTLLFIGADGVEQAVGRTDLDALGGLMRRVPVFATAFLVGVFAIAALPPFNGFVSEWLVLESLLRVVELTPVPVRLTFALSGALLALTAGLTLTCFVMLGGTALLGPARSPAAARARRPARATTLTMWILGGACLTLGVLATAVIPLLGTLVHPLAGGDPGSALVPDFFGVPHGLPSGLAPALDAIGARIGHGLLPLRSLVILHSAGAASPVVFAMSSALSALVLLVVLLGVAALRRWLRTGGAPRRAPVWDAGLARLHPEMHYTATAFSAPVRVLFASLFNPAVRVRLEHRQGFRVAMKREARLVHVVERWTLRPLIRLVHATAALLGRAHRGRVTVYAAYVLASLCVALLIAVLTVA